MSRAPSNPLFYADDEICHFQTEAVGQGVTERFECGKPLSGSYVTVTKPGNDPLALCEVEVYGYYGESKTKPKNITNNHRSGLQKWS